LKLLEERGEFGEMSESTLLWDGIIIRLTRQKSFNSFINNSSLNLFICAMDNSEYRTGNENYSGQEKDTKN
jgi:hypothetical protein